MAGRTALAVALLGASATASAGGLLLYEVATDDVGLASAGYSARAQDASTVLTNPAGMTRLDGTHTLVGVQALYGDTGLSLNSDPSRSAFTASGGDGDNPIGWVPAGSAFISYSVSPDLKIGMGMAGNFGLSLDYGNSWSGRYYAQEATLMGISLLPSLAYKVNDHLSLGASVNAMYGTIESKVAVNNIDPRFGDGRLKLEDNEWGWGGNLGMMYEFNPGTRLGVTYNSQIDLDFTARAKFSNVAPMLDTVLTSRGLKNAKVDLGVKVPQGVMASLFHQINDDWAVLGSVGWQDWSEFGRVEVGVDSNDPTKTTTDLGFKDTWHVALGGQYRFRPDWKLNFGMAYDSEYQSGNVSVMLPTNEAWRFGAGVENEIRKGFSWGAAMEYVYGGDQDLGKTSKVPVAVGGRGDLNGTYENQNILFLSANLKWAF